MLSSPRPEMIERGTGFVYEYGVNLVDDGEGVAALDHLLLVDGHVVTQVVKAQLVIGAVGYICVVGRAALFRGSGRGQ